MKEVRKEGRKERHTTMLDELTCQWLLSVLQIKKARTVSQTIKSIWRNLCVFKSSILKKLSFDVCNTHHKDNVVREVHFYIYFRFVTRLYLIQDAG